MKIVEKTRKRLCIFLTCMVLAAIGIGLFYYYYEMRENGTVSEGTLISNIGTGIQKLWQ